MAVGKNKKLGKKGKGGKRKIVDPFTKKEWYDVKAPNSFKIRQVGVTPVTKSAGNRLAKDSLMGRVFEVSLGDLQKDAENDAFRKFKLRVEDVQGRNCLTNFYGMDLTTDKLRSLVRKWHSLIECFVDVKTSDNYNLRVFVIGFTRKIQNQKKKTSYAQSSQIRAIRKKMGEILKREVASCSIPQLTQKLITGSIGQEIEKATQSIYPLQNVLVRKVKVTRAPKTDMAKLLEAHGGAKAAAASTVDTGAKVERTEQPAAAEQTE
eukprot:TRINITY_DN65336_c0_g3_i1.p2 TRINITY_DN65336_c0_g3~~TRINITY_DN65336_c0_g3_i1.p2  ORF type:complete len:264 (-),score=157.52 TRINITY_DN65336_c0_g3_i1:249-1040(-)